ncbi:MAG: insulinase family protein [Planctomycetota bacterium]
MSCQQGFTVSATPKDLERAFELLHLYFTAPNRDETAFQNLKSRIQATIVNKAQNPEALFADRVPVVNRSNHYSAEPWTTAKLARADLDQALSFYRECFENAQEFTFFIVGNITLESLKPLLEKYLASLPRGERRLTAVKNMGLQFPGGIVKEDVKKGREPKALTLITWPALTGMEDALSFRLRKACDVLEMRLLDIFREQLGKTYSVSVEWSPDAPGTEYATTAVSFGSAPEQVGSMVSRALEEIEKFKAEGPTEKELAAVKEQEVRQEEVSLKQNGFWAGALANYHALKRDPGTINDRIKRARDLSADDVKAAAARFFARTNYTVLTLTPETKE